MIRNDCSKTMETLLGEGFTRKYAEDYLGLAAKEYGNPAFDKEYVEWAHAGGFLAENASAYRLTEEAAGHYLTDYDYAKVWPLNNWTRIWINDKLTLKQMLADTRYDALMPRYFFYCINGKLLKLHDAPNPGKAADEAEFLTVLKEKREFACKPCNGATSQGFFRLTYEAGEIRVNGETLPESRLEQFIREHSNYLFTEYIRPNRFFARYSEHIHTLRIVVLNTNGDNPGIVGGYLRIPHKESGEANYILLSQSEDDQYNLILDVDFTTGRFGSGKKVFIDRVEDAEYHPDTHVKMEGTIDHMEDLREMVLGISRRFCTLEWMGFDIGIAENGFQCMEINSHPGIKYMQVYKPLMDDERVRDFMAGKLDAIGRMNKEQLAIRNSIPR